MPWPAAGQARTMKDPQPVIAWASLGTPLLAGIRLSASLQRPPLYRPSPGGARASDQAFQERRNGRVDALAFDSLAIPWYNPGLAGDGAGIPFERTTLNLFSFLLASMISLWLLYPRAEQRVPVGVCRGHRHVRGARRFANRSH